MSCVPLCRLDQNELFGIVASDVNEVSPVLVPGRRVLVDVRSGSGGMPLPFTTDEFVT